jgi:hypothetical protein
MEVLGAFSIVLLTSLSMTVRPESVVKVKSSEGCG